MDAAKIIQEELRKISSELSDVVIVDHARHKQCVHAAALEEVQAEAEMKVARLKRDVQAAQEMLQLEHQALRSAEAEFREAEEQLVHLRDTVLVDEESSLSQMRQELQVQRDGLAGLLSEVSVYKALNAEIKRGTRG
eukprot:jgi/Ulvmu1/368/UM001_0375.1